MTQGASSWLARAGLLALLPVIALGVWLDGQRYDPGLLDFKQAGARLSPLAGFLPEQVAGMRRQGAPRRFQKENLHDYVNGHAEFFISAGFRELLVGEYGNGARPDVVVDLYDMQTPLFAFGVVTQESQPNARPVAIGAMGSIDSRGMRFIWGPCYIKLTAFADGAPLEEVARTVISLMGKRGAEVQSFRFPEFGEILATRFIKDNYRGLDFFDNVVERSFRREGREVQGFLAAGKDLESRLEGFLQAEKIPVVRWEREGLVLHVVNDPYEGEWFFMRDQEQLVVAFGIPPEAALEPLKRFVEDGDTAQTGKTR